MWYCDLFWLEIWNIFASFVDCEDDNYSKEYLNREKQFETFGDIVGHNTKVWVCK